MRRALYKCMSCIDTNFVDTESRKFHIINNTDENIYVEYICFSRKSQSNRPVTTRLHPGDAFPMVEQFINYQIRVNNSFNSHVKRLHIEYEVQKYGNTLTLVKKCKSTLCSMHRAEVELINSNVLMTKRQIEIPYNKYRSASSLW